jgi:predicted secreted Zn-dependent protease
MPGRCPSASLPRLALCALLVACARRPTVPGLDPLTVPDGVTVIDHVETYPVVGSDRVTVGVALRAGIRDATGRRFAGYHRWRLTWAYETRAQGAHCAATRVTVTLTSTVTLPVWTPPPDVDSALVRQWERYRRALAIHERGHRAITYAGAGRVVRAIRRVSDHSCRFVRDAVRLLVERLLAEIRSEDERYDAETRHGATQGVVWQQ